MLDSLLQSPLLLRLQQTWQGLRQQDKRALLALSALLLVLIVYVFLWLPIQSAQDKANQRLEVAKENWQWLNEQLPLLAQQGAKQQGLELNNNNQLMNYLQAQLRQQNLHQSIDRLDTGANRVTVHFKEVNAPRLFRWLSQMEQQGLIARSANISPIKSGIVQAQVTFEVQQ